MSLQQQLEALQRTHPQLAGTIAARYRQWRAIAGDDSIEAWERKYLGGPEARGEAHLVVLEERAG